MSEATLLDALRTLERAATKVSRFGATTGPQWIGLTSAILKARSELNKSPAEQHQERLEEVLEWNR